MDRRPDIETLKPAKATPLVINQRAEDLTGVADQLKLAPRTVVIGTPAPKGAADTKTGAVVRAVLLDLKKGTAYGAKLQAALKIDVAAREEGLVRRDWAWQGYLSGAALWQGARDGRRLVGGARVLGRTLVKAAVVEERQGLDEAGQVALDERFRPVRMAEEAEQADALSRREKTQRLTAQVQQQVSDAGARRSLMRVMEGLRQGEVFDQATLEEAARTLDSMLVDEDDSGDDRRVQGR